MRHKSERGTRAPFSSLCCLADESIDERNSRSRRSEHDAYSLEFGVLARSAAMGASPPEATRACFFPALTSCEDPHSKAAMGIGTLLVSAASGAWQFYGRTEEVLCNHP